MRAGLKLVCGIGLNDANYKTQVYITENGKQKPVWKCPFYMTWKSMISRCYSKKAQIIYPTYAGCEICLDWIKFSNFKKWMEKQNWQGNALDKDILIQGNKLYSPETCAFVSGSLNNFLTHKKANNNDYPTGVYYVKGSGRFAAECSNPFSKKQEHLGCFSSPHEAHNAWRIKKQEHAHKLAELQSDPRVAEALRNRFAI